MVYLNGSKLTLVTHKKTHTLFPKINWERRAAREDPRGKSIQFQAMVAGKLPKGYARMTTEELAALNARLDRMEKMISAIWEIVGAGPGVSQAYWPPGRRSAEADRQRQSLERDGVWLLSSDSTRRDVGRK